MSQVSRRPGTNALLPFSPIILNETFVLNKNQLCCSRPPARRCNYWLFDGHLCALPTDVMNRIVHLALFPTITERVFHFIPLQIKSLYFLVSQRNFLISDQLHGSSPVPFLLLLYFHGQRTRKWPNCHCYLPLNKKHYPKRYSQIRSSPMYQVYSVYNEYM